MNQRVEVAFVARWRKRRRRRRRVRMEMIIYQETCDKESKAYFFLSKQQ